MSLDAQLGRRLAAELIGTGLLLAAVVGSGIAATRLTTDPGLQLLINAVATAGALVALIVALGPVSGAHFNPVVTLADTYFGGMARGEAVLYLGSQVVGACLGTILANVMFDLPAISWSTTTRTGGGLMTAELAATTGLLLVIFGAARSERSSWTPLVVGAYIGSAYFFTSSTSFANPAVTLARTLSDTFAGIAPASVPRFIAAQVAGLLVALVLVRFLFPRAAATAANVVLPHEEDPTP